MDRIGLSDVALRLSVNLYGAPALSLKEFSQYHQDIIIGASLLGNRALRGVHGVRIGEYRYEPLVIHALARSVSKALKQSTFEGATGVTLFTHNDEFLGNNTRQQDPLFSVQGHVIYNFNRNCGPRWMELTTPAAARR